VPTTFNARVKGMGVGEEFDGDLAEQCRRVWIRGLHHATTTADMLNELGLDKSRANRVIEPFMWHTAILTATEWTNFLGLRCPDGDTPDVNFPAQLEMQQLAICIRDALAGSTPKLLEEGSWAAPMFDWDEEFELLRGFMGGLAVPINEAINAALLVSSRRLARVSYDKHTDTEPLMDSYNKGIKLANDGHYSPMEHPVRPVTHTDLGNPAVSHKLHAGLDLFRNDRKINHGKLPLDRIWSGNLRGVVQFRKLLPYEDDASFKRSLAAAEKYAEETV
jgi:hypothetical protein